MNTEHPHEELSAYLDGQARDPAAVTRHLERCPECARRYEELCGLSSALKALPPLQVHPAFLTRVIAGAAEARVIGYRRWMRLGFPLTGVMAAAAATIVVFLSMLRGVPTPQPPVITVAQGPPPVTEPAPGETDVASLDEIEMPAWTGDDAEASETEYLLAALSDSDGMAALTGDWEQGDDLDAAIAALDESDTEVLRNLITEYTKELDNWE